MIIGDVMTDKITLHGLGFVQVQLQGDQRLHVWHPELPRRSCFEHSAIHDHRFSFTSRVLVGQQINHRYDAIRKDEGEFVLYLHEGKRQAGGTYQSIAYDYHRTEPGGDGRVATVMKKLEEGQRGAHSTCRYGVQPDTDFDRFQWPAARLWEVVRDVLPS